MVTLTNDSYLLQMFSVVQLDACLLQVQKTHECLLFVWEALCCDNVVNVPHDRPER